MSGGTFAKLDAARTAVIAEGSRFTDRLEPILGESLRAGFERLSIGPRDGAPPLDDPARAALRTAVDRAIAEGVGRVVERLRSPEIWLAPLTAPDLAARERPGWSIDVPGWIARALRDRRRGSDRPALGALDDPANRIWVAVTGAAGPVDTVLEEAGFRPGRRRIGGRFGLGPRSIGQLDPGGTLQRCWRGYRAAYERLAALTQEPEDDRPRGSSAAPTG